MSHENTTMLGLTYLAAIHLDTGKTDHLTEVEGSALYYVTALAFDPADRSNPGKMFPPMKEVAHAS